MFHKLLALVVLTTVTVVLSATPTQAADSSGVTIGTLNGAFFTNPTNSGAFTATPADTPVFSQTFPQLDFNPPAGTVQCTNDTGVNEFTRPFTDVVQQADGSCSTIVAEGNGQQAGVGGLSAFDAAFSATITLAQAGDVTFGFFSDDGWIMGIGAGPGGAQPTYVSGPMINPPPSSPFFGYQIVGSYNIPSSPTQNLLVVNFPAAGTYPVELDYSECCGGQLSFTLQANGAPIPPGGTNKLTVTKSGTGSGTVTSSPAGIDCGSTCVFDFSTGTPVTLTATADGGSTFAGWSGDCTGTGSCMVTMDQDHAVTAIFTPAVVAVGVDVKPGSFPNSFNCGSLGNLPVAILGSASFDATTVDVSTVTLEAAVDTISALQKSVIQDVNGDGILDIVVYFSNAQVSAEIGCPLHKGTVVPVTISGSTLGGLSFSGSDTLRISK